jgi:broad specificity phosphatase PhoE
MRQRGALSRIVIAALLAGASLAATPAVASAQKAVILVRHAEKVDDSEDPLLSPAGVARAAALARQLGRAGISQIFVTQFQRTQLTAAPLAAALKLTPVVVTANTTAPLVDRIRRDHANDVVLVVGHSNTVPALIKQFGHPELLTIADDEYDALFVLVPRGQGPPSLIRLRF